MKKMRCILLAVCLLFLWGAQNASAQTPPPLKINEKSVSLEGCVLKEGRVYLLAGDFTALDDGIRVVEEKNQVILEKDGITLIFTPEVETFERNIKRLETLYGNAPFYDGGGCYIPLADAARALGYYVRWENGTVHIFTDPVAITRMNKMALPLEKALFQRMPEDQDTVFSSLSLKYALALLANGVDEESRDEILSLMGHGSMEEMNSYLKKVMEEANNFKYASGYRVDHENQRYVPVENVKIGTQLDIANAVWLEQAAFFPEEAVLNPDYIKTVREYLNGEVFILEDDADYGQIDRWVREKTNGLIQGAGVKEDFYALLMNAIYFDASWKDTFRESWTEPEDFTQKDGTKITMDFMQQNDALYSYNIRLEDGSYLAWQNYAENSWAQVYSKPYVEDHLSMVFILPKDENWQLDAIDVGGALQSLYLNPIEDPAYGEEYYTIIRMKVPKFSTSFDGGEQFMEALQSIGVNKIFETTDYSNMLQSGTFIRDDWEVTQQAVLSIDEDGTKAGALTTFAPAGSSGTPIEIRYVDFYLDRPFVYLVYDHKNDEALFAGALLYGNR